MTDHSQPRQKNFLCWLGWHRWSYYVDGGISNGRPSRYCRSCKVAFHWHYVKERWIEHDLLSCREEKWPEVIDVGQED